LNWDDTTGLLEFDLIHKVADIPYGERWNGQRPQVWGAGPNDNQRWWRYAPASGLSGGSVPKTAWQQLRTGNFCLDVKEGHTYGGAELQIWDCAGADSYNQAFWFD
jgi:hypothetical protein